MKQLGGLEEDRAKFEEKGAQIIVVAVQSQKAAETSKMAARVHFPFLADTDHAVADAFGVFNLLEDPIMQNEATPAVFIINKDGQIVWSEIAENSDQRTQSETILANLP